MLPSQLQSDGERCRLIVLSQDRNSVLLLTEGKGFVLRSIQIPRGQRVAEHLTTATLANYGCTAISLFGLETSTPASDNLYCQVLECRCDGKQHVNNAVWIPIRPVAGDSFQDERDFRNVRLCATKCESFETDPKAILARRGWFSQVCSWVAEAIKPGGFELCGRFRQVSAGPSFSLIRFETSGPAIWLKAVGEKNQNEFAITQELSQLLPAYVPQVIAKCTAWNAWLSPEAPGIELRLLADQASWTAAAQALASLQIESMPKAVPTIRERARHLTIPALAGAVDPFLATVERLMNKQTKVPPAPLNTQEVLLLHRRINESLAFLEELGIPDALGQLDLNPGNIIVAAERCAFLDWAGGYVGQPFLCFQYLLEHFRRRVSRDVRIESIISKAYATQWAQVLPPRDVYQAMAQVPLVAVFAYAANSDLWREPEKLIDEQNAGYLRALARRMSLEAERLADRRTPCLN